MYYVENRLNPLWNIIQLKAINNQKKKRVYDKLSLIEIDEYYKSSLYLNHKIDRESWDIKYSLNWIVNNNYE